MALEVTPVHRNLHQRVTFFYLEFEDLIAVLGLAAVTNIFGRFLGPRAIRHPAEYLSAYVVPVIAVPR